MALLFLDSVQDYAATADLDSHNVGSPTGLPRYLRSSTLTLETGGAGKFGGTNNLHSNGRGVTQSSIDLFTTFSTVHFAGYVKFDALPSSGDFLLSAFTVGGSHIDLKFGANQVVIARDWNDNNTLATEAGGTGYFNGKTGTWVHLEVKWTPTTGAGIVEVWLDGNHIISYAGSTGASSAAVQRIVLAGAVARESDWDQIAIWDDSGSAFAPAQLGAVSGSFVGHRIMDTRPSGNGTTNQFTATGTTPNSACVDEIFTNDGTDYVASSTVNQTDLYNFTDLSTGTYQIEAVQQVQYTRIGFATVVWTAQCRSGGTTFANASSQTSSSSAYNQYTDLWYVDPNTSAAWTETSLNAAEFGIKQNTNGSTVEQRVSAVKLMVLLAGVATITISTTIDQTLPGLTQAMADTETEPGTIAQTLPGIVQTFLGNTFSGSAIDTFLPSIIQEIDVASFAGTIDQTLTKITQSLAGHVPLAAPNFVNKGTRGTQSFGTSVSPSLPASLVVGNFLLCMVGNGVAAGKTFAFPAGWTVIDTFANGNMGAAWAYRFVDGTETTPAITWTGSTSAEAQIWQFHGVVNVGSKNQLGDQGFISTYSDTAITTTGENSLVVNVNYNNNSRTISGTPSGYTVESNDASFGLVDQTVATSGNNSSPITAQALSGSARSISIELELMSVIPPNFAAWASTEVKDVWTSHGSLIGGSWHSTEIADIMIPPFGTWASVEAADIMADVGDPTPPLSIDTRTTGGASGTSSTGVTSATVAITTSFKDDIIVLGIHSGGFWHQGEVIGVSDTAGLFWQRRNQRQVLQNHLGSLTDSWVEEWWAHKPLPGATTITVTTDPTGAIAIEAVAVAGANTSTPFDTHTGAAMAIDNYGGDVIDRLGRGHTGNPAMLLYTDSAKSLTLAFHASPDTQADTSVPSGFTFLGRCEHDEGSGNTLFAASMYKVNTAQQFGTTDVWFGPDGTHITNRYLIVDTLIGRDQTAGTAGIVRWYFDGNGNRTIDQYSTGQNSSSLNLVTFRENSLVIVAVMSLTGVPGGARVDSISDAGNHSGWTRRGIVTDNSGQVALETWYVEMAEPFSGDVTITMNSDIQNGDYVSAICFAIHGADSGARGEIWDHNASLPATNHGNSTGGHQTVGPFSSSDDNVLVLAFGANIDATVNDTDPTGKNKLPFLQLPDPAELVSDGPPSFHIALDYKFSEPVVTDVSTEIDVSPTPQSWLMLADAIPVGPVSPPHGSLITTETKDQFRHVGDYTAIGVASPGGWFGFIPNSAALGAAETQDHTSNSGAFTAIWGEDEGWIAYVPAFMSSHPTEADDVMLDRGWVLGPRTIIGHMHPTEAPDRLNFSGLHTYYTTADSKGDRTSRITVTTNVTLVAGTVDNLVDGVKANGAANAITVANSQPAAMFFTFDFLTGKVVNEATWFQNGPFAQPGLWRWRGSMDNATWTILSAADFTLDGLNIGTVIGDMSANETAYRYYQLIQTTNAGGTDIPQLWEMEFKVAGFGAAMAATESKDRLAGNMLAIPTATPIPARKRQMLIVT